MRWTILTLLTLATFIPSCPGKKSKRSEQVDCLVRCINPQMIKDMLRTLKDINRSLPNVNKEKSRQHRYVPRFFMKKKLNVAGINKILGIYEDHVFKKLWTGDMKDPNSFTHAFSRLKGTMEYCKGHSQATLAPKIKETIKDMEESFKKLRPDELWNAVGDFQTVLHWISLYMDKKTWHSKNAKSFTN